MNDAYFKEQSQRVRAIADKADPFTKKRLLALAETYDARIGRPSRATRQLPLVSIDNGKPADNPDEGKTAR
ncbi:MAG: hypothetical protein J0H42_25465 [Rhizobiales bacterium]|nr:hypothetical protein [Hyphomicrobiales bacterium]